MKPLKPIASLNSQGLNLLSDPIGSSHIGNAKDGAIPWLSSSVLTLQIDRITSRRPLLERFLPLM